MGSSTLHATSSIYLFHPSFHPNRFAAVRGLTTYKSFGSSLRRAANSARPAVPNSVERFLQQLPTSLVHATNLEGEPFFLESVHVGENVHVIFGSVAVAEAVSDGRPVELHTDAAVKTVPGLFSQLLVVHVVGGDNVSI